jgi:hypothetical protein
MPKLSHEERVVRQIIKEYGAKLDLRADPDTFVEIVRKYAVDLAVSSPNGGLPPGGVGPVGPTSIQSGPDLRDIMKEILKLQRQLAKLGKQISRK